MAETPISQETSDVTIFPLAVLPLHLLLLLTAVDSKMSLHSVPFFCEALEMSHSSSPVINFLYSCNSSAQRKYLPHLHRSEMKSSLSTDWKTGSPLITNSVLF